MITLGIKPSGHDTGAAVVIDGKIVAASAEERFNREKHSQKFPFNSIKFCMQQAGITEKAIDKVLKRYPKDKNEIFSRDQLIQGIELEIQNSKTPSPAGLPLEKGESLLKSRLTHLISQIKMKPTRTISGVTTVTVLTKPFACPGQCVFCPNDIRMPKSYITSEPGAQRALMNRFSPYTQVFNRLQAIKSIGHPTQKIELLVLGGTWSYYTRKYKAWFIKECFRAMNHFSYQPSAVSDKLDTYDITDDLKNDINVTLRERIGDKPYNQLIVSKEYKELFADKIYDDSEALSIDELWKQLESEQEINSHGDCRCVGLVLETRPDTITPQEVYDLRKLGATKIQIGIQTLNDEISKANKRGETKADTARAFALLRAGGFKIHGHIMPNLFKSTPEIDEQTYKELFESEDYKPDELKIYPTSVIKNTELYKYWQNGEYQPYSTPELVNLIADFMEATPEYCRLTRIIRDIPSTEIESGNKTTNLRELVERKLKDEKRKNGNIRAREVGSKKLEAHDLALDIVEYKTSISTEYFLQYITEKREIAGFLRLSIPTTPSSASGIHPSFTKEGIFCSPITPELDGCAIIREVHVYGPSLELKKDSHGEAQHLGLGTKLIQKAKELAKENGFKKLAVISSIGTREYYQKRGFELKELYQVAELG